MQYGCKTCRLIEKSKRALKTRDRDTIRRSMRISQKEKKLLRFRNEEVKQRMRIEDSIIDDVKRKQCV